MNIKEVDYLTNGLKNGDKLQIVGEEIRNVNKFKYLESRFGSDKNSCCETEELGIKFSCRNIGANLL